jgi:hypothetical protein
MGYRIAQLLMAWTLPLPLAGCSTWQTSETVPQVLLAPDDPNRPPEILVRTLGGSNERLRSPRLVGDTVVGTLPSNRASDAPERKIPLDSITSIETLRFSGGTSAGVFLLTLLVGVAAVTVWVFTHWPQS